MILLSPKKKGREGKGKERNCPWRFNSYSGKKKKIYQLRPLLPPMRRERRGRFTFPFLSLCEKGREKGT